MCSKAFTTKSKLKRHISTHEHDGKTFECYLCPYKFEHIYSLRVHFNAKHVIAKREELHCTYCTKTYLSHKTLDLHIRIVSPVSQFHIIGDLLIARFLSVSPFYCSTHLQHQGLKPSYKCAQCDKVFDRRANLMMHLEVHSDFKRFVCETCGMTFKTQKRLVAHLRKHSGEKPFKCTECGQYLKSSATYKNHMRQHTGERPFACHLCDRTYVQKAHLIKHLMVHNQEKPHQCTMCQKGFATAYDLKLHSSVHTGAKPFGCTLCNKYFTQPSTLRAHTKKIHTKNGSNVTVSHNC